MTNNLPEPDDAPWLNLTPQEVEELRYNKQELTKYGREKIKALMLKSQMKETDISKVLIEGDTATIMGVKYKRVEEPKPQTLFDIILSLGHSYDRCYEIVDAVKEWLPDEHCNITDYDLGWNDVLRKIKDGLG